MMSTHLGCTTFVAVASDHYVTRYRKAGRTHAPDRAVLVAHGEIAEQQSQTPANTAMALSFFAPDGFALKSPVDSLLFDAATERFHTHQVPHLMLSPVNTGCFAHQLASLKLWVLEDDYDVICLHQSMSLAMLLQCSELESQYDVLEVFACRDNGEDPDKIYQLPLAMNKPLTGALASDTSWVTYGRSKYGQKTPVDTGHVKPGVEDFNDYVSSYLSDLTKAVNHIRSPHLQQPDPFWIDRISRLDAHFNGPAFRFALEAGIGRQTGYYDDSLVTRLDEFRHGIEEVVGHRIDLGIDHLKNAPEIPGNDVINDALALVEAANEAIEFYNGLTQKQKGEAGEVDADEAESLEAVAKVLGKHPRKLPELKDETLETLAKFDKTVSKLSRTDDDETRITDEETLSLPWVEKLTPGLQLDRLQSPGFEPLLIGEDQSRAEAFEGDSPALFDKVTNTNIPGVLVGHNDDDPEARDQALTLIKDGLADTDAPVQATFAKQLFTAGKLAEENTGIAGDVYGVPSEGFVLGVDKDTDTGVSSFNQTTDDGTRQSLIRATLSDDASPAENLANASRELSNVITAAGFSAEGDDAFSSNSRQIQLTPDTLVKWVVGAEEHASIGGDDGVASNEPVPVSVKGTDATDTTAAQAPNGDEEDTTTAGGVPNEPPPPYPDNGSPDDSADSDAASISGAPAGGPPDDPSSGSGSESGNEGASINAAARGRGEPVSDYDHYVSQYLSQLADNVALLRDPTLSKFKAEWLTSVADLRNFADSNLQEFATEIGLSRETGYYEPDLIPRLQKFRQGLEGGLGHSLDLPIEGQVDSPTAVPGRDPAEALESLQSAITKAIDFYDDLNTAQKALLGEGYGFTEDVAKDLIRTQQELNTDIESGRALAVGDKAVLQPLVDSLSKEVLGALDKLDQGVSHLSLSENPQLKLAHPELADWVDELTPDLQVQRLTSPGFRVVPVGEPLDLTDEGVGGFPRVGRTNVPGLLIGSDDDIGYKAFDVINTGLDPERNPTAEGFAKQLYAATQTAESNGDSFEFRYEGRPKGFVLGVAPDDTGVDVSARPYDDNANQAFTSRINENASIHEQIAQTVHDLGEIATRAAFGYAVTGESGNVELAPDLRIDITPRQSVQRSLGENEDLLRGTGFAASKRAGADTSSTLGNFTENDYRLAAGEPLVLGASDPNTVQVHSAALPKGFTNRADAVDFPEDARYFESPQEVAAFLETTQSRLDTYRTLLEATNEFKANAVKSQREAIGEAREGFKGALRANEDKLSEAAALSHFDRISNTDSASLSDQQAIDELVSFGARIGQQLDEVTPALTVGFAEKFQADVDKFYSPLRPQGEGDASFGEQFAERFGKISLTERGNEAFGSSSLHSPKGGFSGDYTAAGRKAQDAFARELGETGGLDPYSDSVVLSGESLGTARDGEDSSRGLPTSDAFKKLLTTAFDDIQSRAQAFEAGAEDDSSVRNLRFNESRSVTRALDKAIGIYGGAEEDASHFVQGLVDARAELNPESAEGKGALAALDERLQILNHATELDGNPIQFTVDLHDQISSLVEGKGAYDLLGGLSRDPGFVANADVRDGVIHYYNSEGDEVASPAFINIDGAERVRAFNQYHLENGDRLYLGKDGGEDFAVSGELFDRINALITPGSDLNPADAAFSFDYLASLSRNDEASVSDEFLAEAVSYKLKQLAAASDFADENSTAHQAFDALTAKVDSFVDEYAANHNLNDTRTFVRILGDNYQPSEDVTRPEALIWLAGKSPQADEGTVASSFDYFAGLAADDLTDRAYSSDRGAVGLAKLVSGKLKSISDALNDPDVGDTTGLLQTRDQLVELTKGYLDDLQETSPVQTAEFYRLFSSRFKDATEFNDQLKADLGYRPDIVQELNTRSAKAQLDDEFPTLGAYDDATGGGKTAFTVFANRLIEDPRQLASAISFKDGRAEDFYDLLHPKNESAGARPLGDDDVLQGKGTAPDTAFVDKVSGLVDDTLKAYVRSGGDASPFVEALLYVEDGLRHTANLPDDASLFNGDNLLSEAARIKAINGKPLNIADELRSKLEAGAAAHVSTDDPDVPTVTEIEIIGDDSAYQAGVYYLDADDNPVQVPTINPDLTVEGYDSYTLDDGSILYINQKNSRQQFEITSDVAEEINWIASGNLSADPAVIDASLAYAQYLADNNLGSYTPQQFVQQLGEKYVAYADADAYSSAGYERFLQDTLGYISDLEENSVELYQILDQTIEGGSGDPLVFFQETAFAYPGLEGDLIDAFPTYNPNEQAQIDAFQAFADVVGIGIPASSVIEGTTNDYLHIISAVTDNPDEVDGFVLIPSDAQETTAVQNQKIVDGLTAALVTLGAEGGDASAVVNATADYITEYGQTNADAFAGVVQILDQLDSVNGQPVTISDAARENIHVAVTGSADAPDAQLPTVASIAVEDGAIVYLDSNNEPVFTGQQPAFTANSAGEDFDEYGLTNGDTVFINPNDPDANFEVTQAALDSVSWLTSDTLDAPTDEIQLSFDYYEALAEDPASPVTPQAFATMVANKLAGFVAEGDVTSDAYLTLLNETEDYLSAVQQNNPDAVAAFNDALSTAFNGNPEQLFTETLAANPGMQSGLIAAFPELNPNEDVQIDALHAFADAVGEPIPVDDNVTGGAADYTQLISQLPEGSDALVIQGTEAAIQTIAKEGGDATAIFVAFTDYLQSDEDPVQLTAFAQVLDKVTAINGVPLNVSDQARADLGEATGVQLSAEGVGTLDIVNTITVNEAGDIVYTDAFGYPVQVDPSVAITANGTANSVRYTLPDGSYAYVSDTGAVALVNPAAVDDISWLETDELNATPEQITDSFNYYKALAATPDNGFTQTDFANLFSNRLAEYVDNGAVDTEAFTTLLHDVEDYVTAYPTQTLTVEHALAEAFDGYGSNFFNAVSDVLPDEKAGLIAAFPDTNPNKQAQIDALNTFAKALGVEDQVPAGAVGNEANYDTVINAAEAATTAGDGGEAEASGDASTGSVEVPQLLDAVQQTLNILAEDGGDGTAVVEAYVTYLNDLQGPVDVGAFASLIPQLASIDGNPISINSQARADLTDALTQQGVDTTIPVVASVAVDESTNQILYFDADGNPLPEGSAVPFTAKGPLDGYDTYTTLDGNTVYSNGDVTYAVTDQAVQSVSWLVGDDLNADPAAVSLSFEYYEVLSTTPGSGVTPESFDQMVTQKLAEYVNQGLEDTPAFATLVDETQQYVNTLNATNPAQADAFEDALSDAFDGNPEDFFIVAVDAVPSQQSNLIAAFPDLNPNEEVQIEALYAFADALGEVDLVPDDSVGSAAEYTALIDDLADGSQPEGAAGGDLTAALTVDDPRIINAVQASLTVIAQGGGDASAVVVAYTDYLNGISNPVAIEDFANIIPQIAEINGQPLYISPEARAGLSQAIDENTADTAIPTVDAVSVDENGDIIYYDPEGDPLPEGAAAPFTGQGAGPDYVSYTLDNGDIVYSNGAGTTFAVTPNAVDSISWLESDELDGTADQIKASFEYFEAISKIPGSPVDESQFINLVTQKLSDFATADDLASPEYATFLSETDDYVEVLRATDPDAAAQFDAALSDISNGNPQTFFVQSAAAVPEELPSLIAAFPDLNPNKQAQIEALHAFASSLGEDDQVPTNADGSVEDYNDLIEALPPVAEGEDAVPVDQQIVQATEAALDVLAQTGGEGTALVTAFTQYFEQSENPEALAGFAVVLDQVAAINGLAVNISDAARADLETALQLQNQPTDLTVVGGATISADGDIQYLDANGQPIEDVDIPPFTSAGPADSSVYTLADGSTAYVEGSSGQAFEVTDTFEEQIGWLTSDSTDASADEVNFSFDYYRAVSKQPNAPIDTEAFTNIVVNKYGQLVEAGQTGTDAYAALSSDISDYYAELADTSPADATELYNDLLGVVGTDNPEQALLNTFPDIAYEQTYLTLNADVERLDTIETVAIQTLADLTNEPTLVGKSPEEVLGTLDEDAVATITGLLPTDQADEFTATLNLLTAANKAEGAIKDSVVDLEVQLGLGSADALSAESLDDLVDLLGDNIPDKTNGVALQTVPGDADVFNAVNQTVADSQQELTEAITSAQPYLPDDAYQAYSELIPSETPESVPEDITGVYIPSLTADLDLAEQTKGTTVEAVQDAVETIDTESSVSAAATVLQGRRLAVQFEDAVNVALVENDLPSTYVPVLSTITETDDGNYEVEFVDTTSQKVQTVVTDDPTFEEVKEYLDTNTEEALKAYDVQADGSFTPKEGEEELPEAEGINTLNAAFAVQSLVSYFEHGELAENTEDAQLASVFEAHQYVNLARIGYGLILDTTHVVSLVKSLSATTEAATEAAEETASAASTTFTAVGQVAAAGVDVIFALASVGLDIYELTQVTTDAEKAAVGTQLAFDAGSAILGGVSIGLSAASAAGVTAAAAAGAVVGGVGVIFAGIGIGVVALVDTYSSIADDAEAVGEYFYEIDETYSEGGFTYDSDTDSLVPVGAGVITEVNYQNQTITYGSPMLYATTRHGTDTGSNDIFWAGDFPTVDYDKSDAINVREALGYSQTAFLPDPYSTVLIAPVTPVAYIDYDWNTLPGATTDNSEGYDVLRSIEDDESFDFDFYIFPSEYIIDDVTLSYQKTDIDIILDQQNRTIAFPDIPDDYVGYLHYDLEGDGGQYIIALNDDVEITTSADGNVNNTWILDSTNEDSHNISVSGNTVTIGDASVTFDDASSATVLISQQDGDVITPNFDDDSLTVVLVNGETLDDNNQPTGQPRPDLQSHLNDLEKSGELGEFTLITNYHAPDGQKYSSVYYDSVDDVFIVGDGITPDMIPLQRVVVTDPTTAVVPTGTILLADSDNHEIVAYDPNTGEVTDTFKIPGLNSTAVITGADASSGLVVQVQEQIGDGSTVGLLFSYQNDEFVLETIYGDTSLYNELSGVTNFDIQELTNVFTAPVPVARTLTVAVDGQTPYYIDTTTGDVIQPTVEGGFAPNLILASQDLEAATTIGGSEVYLNATVYFADHAPTSIEDAESVIAAPGAQGTPIAINEVDWHPVFLGGDYYTFSDFLGQNGDVGDDEGKFINNTVIEIDGQIYLTAGEHQLLVENDDGLELSINDQVLISENTADPYGDYDYVTFSVPEDGFYPINAVYYQDGGWANLDIQIDNKPLSTGNFSPPPEQPEDVNAPKPGAYLEGEVYLAPAAPYSISEAQAVVDQQGKFGGYDVKIDTLDFAKTGSDATIGAFLGSNADAGAGDSKQNTNTVYTIDGQIYLTAGEHDLYVANDDGLMLSINNQVLVEQNSWDAGYSHEVTFTVPEDGYYPINVVYYQDGGGAYLDVKIDGEDVSAENFAGPDGVITPPKEQPLVLGTSIVYNGDFSQTSVLLDPDFDPSYDVIDGYVALGWQSSIAEGGGFGYVPENYQTEKPSGELWVSKGETVSQELQTIPGQDYVITFDESSVPGIYEGTETVQVYWDDQLVGTINSSEIDGSINPDYQTVTFKVTGTGDDTLSFVGVTDVFIDNVAVQPIIADGQPITDPEQAPPLGPNLIYNGNFEQVLNPDAYGNGTALGWTATKTFDGEDVLNNPVSYGPGTDGDAKLDVTAGAAVSQTVETEAGQVYLLTFDQSAFPGSVTPDQDLVVYWNGVEVGTVTAQPTDSPDDPGWTTYTYEVVGTGGDDTLTFYSDTGTLVDSVSLEALNTVPNAYETNNLVFNGSFEYATPDGGSQTAVGWTGTRDDNGATYVYDSQNIIAEPTDGNNALDVNGGGSVSQELNTTPGETYELTFDISSLVGFPDGLIQVYWGDEYLGTVNPAVSSSNVDALQWDTVTFTVTADSPSTELTFVGIDSAAIDNVSVVPIDEVGNTTPVADDKYVYGTDNLVENGDFSAFYVEDDNQLTGRVPGWTGSVKGQVKVNPKDPYAPQPISLYSTGSPIPPPPTAPPAPVTNYTEVYVYNGLGGATTYSDDMAWNNKLVVNAGGTVTQEITTIPGQTYVLSFDQSALPNSDGGTITVKWNGEDVATTTVVDDNGVVHETFEVTATSTQSELEFDGVTSTYVDNVSLVTKTIDPEAPDQKAYLQGEVYFVNEKPTSLEQASDEINAMGTDAGTVYQISAIDFDEGYGTDGVNDHTLDDFFQGNATIPSGGDEIHNDAVHTITGSIYLTEGVHTFTFDNDDGLTFSIGGETIYTDEIWDENEPQTATFYAPEDGYYQIGALYYEGTGESRLEITIDGEVLSVDNFMGPDEQTAPYDVPVLYYDPDSKTVYQQLAPNQAAQPIKVGPDPSAVSQQIDGIYAEDNGDLLVQASDGLTWEVTPQGDSTLVAIGPQYLEDNPDWEQDIQKLFANGVPSTIPTQQVSEEDEAVAELAGTSNPAQTAIPIYGVTQADGVTPVSTWYDPINDEFISINIPDNGDPLVLVQVDEGANIAWAYDPDNGVLYKQQLPPTNLVVDGGFENVNPDGTTQGWIGNSGGNKILQSGTPDDHKADLARNDTIYQNIPTVPGQTYIIEFDEYYVQGDDGVSVYWNGQPIAQATIPEGQNEVHQVYEVTATSTTTQLRFYGSSAQYSQTLIDNVEVYPADFDGTEINDNSAEAVAVAGGQSLLSLVPASDGGFIATTTDGLVLDINDDSQTLIGLTSYWTEDNGDTLPDGYTTADTVTLYSGQDTGQIAGWLDTDTGETVSAESFENTQNLTLLGTNGDTGYVLQQEADDQQVLYQVNPDGTNQQLETVDYAQVVTGYNGDKTLLIQDAGTQETLTAPPIEGVNSLYLAGGTGNETYALTSDVLSEYQNITIDNSANTGSTNVIALDSDFDFANTVVTTHGDDLLFVDTETEQTITIEGALNGGSDENLVIQSPGNEDLQVSTIVDSLNADTSGPTTDETGAIEPLSSFYFDQILDSPDTSTSDTSSSSDALQQQDGDIQVSTTTTTTTTTDDSGSTTSTTTEPHQQDLTNSSLDLPVEDPAQTASSDSNAGDGAATADASSTDSSADATTQTTPQGDATTPDNAVPPPEGETDPSYDYLVQQMAAFNTSPDIDVSAPQQNKDKPDSLGVDAEGHSSG